MSKEAVEAVHRAMTDAMGGWVGPNIARIALQAARPFLLEEAARIADRGALVPPDGGAPTPEENAVAENIAAAIRAAKETGE